MRYFIAGIIILSLALPAAANGLPDADRDGIPDQDEINIYKTNKYHADTDGDGYTDREELIKGFSPLDPKPGVALGSHDEDNDGLSDRMELNFHTDLVMPDTDRDGYKDGDEIKGGFDPNQADGATLGKRIEVNLGKQELSYFLGGVRMNTFPVSSGRPGMYTPKGHYQVDGKALRAWSHWGLWMPYWMSLKNGYFGIHELPEWPNGYKEGADHLGKPVSHGCIRLGVGPAKFVYDWAPIGTPVFIY